MLAIGWPFHNTCPEVGASSNASARRNTLLPEPDEPVIDTRSARFRLKSVGCSKSVCRRSSRRVRAWVSIRALMDAVFLSSPVGRHGEASALALKQRSSKYGRGLAPDCGISAPHGLTDTQPSGHKYLHNIRFSTTPKLCRFPRCDGGTSANGSNREDHDRHPPDAPRYDQRLGNNPTAHATTVGSPW